MKLRKLISCVAAASVATAALATAVSAELVTVEQNRIFFSQTSMWMPVIYSDGTVDTKDKDIVDYGLDLSKIGSVEVTFKATDAEWFEGAIGGAIVLSSQKEGDKSHNWNDKQFWGVNDEELGFNTVDDTKPIIAETLGDYTYKVVMPVDDTNNVIDGAQLVQIAFQDFSTDFSPVEVISMVVKDTAGAEMISFDAKGTPSFAPVKQATPDYVAPTLSKVSLADCLVPGDANHSLAIVAGDGTNAYCTNNGIDVTTIYGYRVVGSFADGEAEDESVWLGGSIGTNSPSTGWAQNDWDKSNAILDAKNGTITLLKDAPLFAADDSYAQLWYMIWGGTWTEDHVELLGKDGSVIATTAASAGNVDAATDSTKGSPDTGVADVAVVAGLALVAGGAFIVAKKRK